MNDAAATSLVSAAPRRPVLRRRISAARLIAVGVVVLELIWVGGLSLLLYEVIH